MRVISSSTNGFLGVPNPFPIFFNIAASLALDIGTRVGGLVESTNYAVARVDSLNVILDDVSSTVAASAKTCTEILNFWMYINE